MQTIHIFVFALLVAASRPQEAHINGIAAVLAAEARGEGLSGMKLVAEVMRNRSGYARNRCVTNLMGHITSRKKFSVLNGKSLEGLYREMRHEDGFSDAVVVARTLLESPERLGNRTGGANHYDQVGKSPYWSKGVRGKRIGGHIFYRINPVAIQDR